MTTITIHDSDIDSLRTILREQLSGDHELLNDITEGRESDEEGSLLDGAVSRIMLCEDIARQVGGLVSDGMAQAFLDGYPA